MNALRCRLVIGRSSASVPRADRSRLGGSVRTLLIADELDGTAVIVTDTPPIRSAIDSDKAEIRDERSAEEAHR